MQRLQFTSVINAPAQKVYETMLGLKDKSTYEHWTSAFNPTSTYEGTIDTIDEYLDYFNNTYPLALDKLKALSER